MSRPKLLNLKIAGELDVWLDNENENVPGLDYIDEDKEVREEEE